MSEVSGEPAEENEVYCWDWNDFEPKVLEAIEAEIMEEPYLQLKAEMQQDEEKFKKMNEAAASNLNNPEAIMEISLKQLKSLSSMD